MVGFGLLRGRGFRLIACGSTTVGVVVAVLVGVSVRPFLFTVRQWSGVVTIGGLLSGIRCVLTVGAGGLACPTGWLLRSLGLGGTGLTIGVQRFGASGRGAIIGAWFRVGKVPSAGLVVGGGFAVAGLCRNRFDVRSFCLGGPGRRLGAVVGDVSAAGLVVGRGLAIGGLRCHRFGIRLLGLGGARRGFRAVFG
ncbi:hypothetical protein D0T12_08275 [Actinomadura spongiicola]|uniref:Uncharacterized protein n=1 Tax=Actinomadura spongiicola TaxID=2303421 RepID=A0A372GN44_9ACTN|nr:hypothetical protein D0T12_08275 [Actinomadura spongiicola]